jgi:hypothetical protein
MKKNRDNRRLGAVARFKDQVRGHQARIKTLTSQLDHSNERQKVKILDTISFLEDKISKAEVTLTNTLAKL